MRVDLNSLESGSSLDCELCVVGAGIVGITLARQFVGTNTRVCLLEGGGTDFEAETQALDHGEQVGAEYYPLDDSRLHFFGGSTLVWGGRCVPLDPMDFEYRPWVPSLDQRGGGGCLSVCTVTRKERTRSRNRDRRTFIKRPMEHLGRPLAGFRQLDGKTACGPRFALRGFYRRGVDQ